MEVDTLKSHKIHFYVSVCECYKCFTLTLGEVTCTDTCYSCVPGHLPRMLRVLDRAGPCCSLAWPNVTTCIGDALAPGGPSSPVYVSMYFSHLCVPFDTLLLAASVVEHGLTCPTVGTPTCSSFSSALTAMSLFRRWIVEWSLPCTFLEKDTLSDLFTASHFCVYQVWAPQLHLHSVSSSIFPSLIIYHSLPGKDMWCD